MTRTTLGEPGAWQRPQWLDGWERLDREFARVSEHMTGRAPAGVTSAFAESRKGSSTDAT